MEFDGNRIKENLQSNFVGTHRSKTKPYVQGELLRKRKCGLKINLKLKLLTRKITLLYCNLTPQIHSQPSQDTSQNDGPFFSQKCSSLSCIH